TLPVAVFSGEVIVDDANFLQTFSVRKNSRFVESSAHDGKAIELNIVLKRAAAVHAICGKLRPAGDADAERPDGCAVRSVVSRLHAVLERRVIQRVLGDVRKRIDDGCAGGAGNTAGIGLKLVRSGDHLDL